MLKVSIFNFKLYNSLNCRAPMLTIELFLYFNLLIFNVLSCNVNSMLTQCEICMNIFLYL